MAWILSSPQSTVRDGFSSGQLEIATPCCEPASTHLESGENTNAVIGDCATHDAAKQSAKNNSAKEIHRTIRHFSPIATNWFQGSALEPTELQALPAEPKIIRARPSLQCEAEPREQFIPRRSQGTRIKNGGVVAKKPLWVLKQFVLDLTITCPLGNPRNKVACLIDANRATIWGNQLILRIDSQQRVDRMGEVCWRDRLIEWALADSVA